MSRLFFFLRVLAGLMVALWGGWCLGAEWEKEVYVLAPEVEERWAGWMGGGAAIAGKEGDGADGGGD